MNDSICYNKIVFRKAITYGNYMILLFSFDRYLIVSKEDFNVHWASISSSCYAIVKALYSVDINL